MDPECATLPTAPQATHSFFEQRQSLQSMSADESTTLDSCRRAIEQHDEQAWEQVSQHWSGTLIHWLRLHPCARLALEQEAPEHYVAEALKKFWQATTRSNAPQQPVSTLADMLLYLRCCLNSVVLDAVQQARHRQLAVSASCAVEDRGSQPHHVRDADFWRSIKRALPERRERLLVLLRYVQGERPSEVVAAHPQAFPSVTEVYRLERAILARLRRHPALTRLVDRL